MVLNIINSTAERYRNNVSIVKGEEAAAAGNNIEGSVEKSCTWHANSRKHAIFQRATKQLKKK